MLVASERGASSVYWMTYCGWMGRVIRRVVCCSAAWLVVCHEVGLKFKFGFIFVIFFLKFKFSFEFELLHVWVRDILPRCQ